MRRLIAIVLICLSGCTITPKDQAWITAVETSSPPGVDGNCLPVAQRLQELYGGRIAVLSHPDRPRSRHAVLMVSDDEFLDNGTIGYGGPWSKAANKGWRFEYWWRP